MRLVRATGVLGLVCGMMGCNNDQQMADEATTASSPTLPTAAPSKPVDDFLGMRLGQPLALAECKRESKQRYVYWRQQPTLPCWAHPVGPDGSIPSSSEPDPRMNFTIVLGNPNVPLGFEPEAKAFAIDGDLVHVELRRASLPSSAIIDFRRLVEKYGAPQTSDQNAFLWTLPSFHIIYLPHVGNGMVQASTPAYVARRQKSYRQGF